MTSMVVENHRSLIDLEFVAPRLLRAFCWRISDPLQLPTLLQFCCAIDVPLAADLALAMLPSSPLR